MFVVKKKMNLLGVQLSKHINRSTQDFQETKYSQGAPKYAHMLLLIEIRLSEGKSTIPRLENHCCLVIKNNISI